MLLFGDSDRGSRLKLHASTRQASKYCEVDWCSRKQSITKGAEIEALREMVRGPYAIWVGKLEDRDRGGARMDEIIRFSLAVDPENNWN